MKKEGVTAKVALLILLLSILLATTLAGCARPVPASILKEGKIALKGEITTVGKVTLIRYQPENIATRASLDRAGLDRLAAGFARMIEQGDHSGAQLAIYRQGQLVLALAGGTDVKSGKPITFDSLFSMRSCTKALTALVMAILYDRGLFRFDDPVMKYWPEFGQNGKAEITIGQVMSHRAGIPQGLSIPVLEYGNRPAVARAIEELKPIWRPGTANGYHALTYGWVLDELAIRLTGHNIASLLRAEVTEPLGIRDIYLGLPESEYPRFCPMAVLDQTNLQRAAFSDFLNSYNGVRFPIPAANGIANAWDLAQVFNIFAFEGTFGDRTFLSRETQALISTPTNSPDEMDVVLRWPARWGLGVILGDTPDIYGTPPHPRAIGHAGGGASVVWADPDERLAVAFLCNGMRTGGREWERYRILGDLVYGALLPLKPQASK